MAVPYIILIYVSVSVAKYFIITPDTIKSISAYSISIPTLQDFDERSGPSSFPGYVVMGESQAQGLKKYKQGTELDGSLSPLSSKSLWHYYHCEKTICEMALC